jgi:hypothetical protein
LIAYKSIAEHNPDVMNMSFKTFATKKGIAYNISIELKWNLTKITVSFKIKFILKFALITLPSDSIGCDASKSNGPYKVHDNFKLHGRCLQNFAVEIKKLDHEFYL